MLKTATLAISDYIFLSILPLKERLNYNDGVLIHKIVRKSQTVPTAKVSLNQDILENSRYESLGLTFSSLA